MGSTLHTAIDAGGLKAETCETHGGHINDRGWCQTWTVLQDVGHERARQFQQYGTNDDIADGSGPDARWLLPYTVMSAEDIEAELREDYEQFQEETGTVTWVHLLREELAEAFAETDPVKLRAELLQVAALAVSWVEKIDARQALGLPAPALPDTDEVPC